MAASDISRYETSIVKFRKQRIKERLNINDSYRKIRHISPIRVVA